LIVRGFTLAELAFVIVLASLVAAAILARVVPLIGQAERAAFYKTEAELRSALLLEAAARIARGEGATLVDLARSNPVDLLLNEPTNYLPPTDAATAARGPRPSWQFDTDRGVLIYRLGRHTRFEPIEGPDDRIELAVGFQFDDRNENGRFEPGVDTFYRLELSPVHAYRWPQGTDG
jgi:type II secretory pathway pseudopilin PulG